MDTTIITPFGNCGIGIASAQIADLQLEKRNGSRLRHGFKGLLIGALIGGVAGRIIAGDGCKPGGCDDGYYAIIEFTGAGLVVGGVLGSAVGLVLPAGVRWHSVNAPFARVEYNP